MPQLLTLGGVLEGAISAQEDVESSSGFGQVSNL